MKKSRISLFAVGLLFALMNATVIGISYRYDIALYQTWRIIVRAATLMVIDGAVNVYDPSEINTGPTGPVDDWYRGKGEYFRADELIRRKWENEEYRVVGVSNEKILRSRYEFRYQPYNETKLVQLRSEYKLDQVVEGSESEFEAMIQLRNWTRSQFRRKDYQPRQKHFDGLELLRRNARNSDNKPHQRYQYRPCHFFPMLYSQVMLSMGHQSRLVKISGLDERGYDGHGMTEVWSNQFRKWVTMDVDLNLHYEREGVPINMLEVHNELYQNDGTAIQVIRGKQTSGDEETDKKIRFADRLALGKRYEEYEGNYIPVSFRIDEMILYHTYIQIADMRNDWMTNHYFRGHPSRSDRATLSWKDERQPVFFHFNPETERTEDFYWTLNQTEIWVRRSIEQDETMHLAFRTFTPNFRNFEILIDRDMKIETVDALFEWELEPGLNRLEIRSVNQFGVPGIESWLEVEPRSDRS